MSLGYSNEKVKKHKGIENSIMFHVKHFSYA